MTFTASIAAKRRAGSQGGGAKKNEAINLFLSNWPLKLFKPKQIDHCSG